MNIAEEHEAARLRNFRRGASYAPMQREAEAIEFQGVRLARMTRADLLAVGGALARERARLIIGSKDGAA